MTDILQDEDGDVNVTNNQTSLVNGANEVMQLLRQRLRTFLAEWFLDTTIGIPYFQDIFKKNPSPIAMESAFKNEILNTPGVLELSEFELEVDPSLRTLTVTGRAVVTDGIIDFSEVLTP